MDTLFITNAPSWSVVFKDCADIVVHDMTIFIGAYTIPYSFVQCHVMSWNAMCGSVTNQSSRADTTVSHLT